MPRSTAEHVRAWVLGPSILPAATPLSAQLELPGPRGPPPAPPASKPRRSFRKRRHPQHVLIIPIYTLPRRKSLLFHTSNVSCFHFLFLHSQNCFLNYPRVSPNISMHLCSFIAFYTHFTIGLGLEMRVFQDNLGKTHGLMLNLPTKKNKVSYTSSSHHTWPIFFINDHFLQVD